MQWHDDADGDVASLDLVDHIAEGEIDQDVGPQLTPNRQSIVMSYDAAGNLLSLELWAVSNILRPRTLQTRHVRLVHDEEGDTARLYFTEEEVDDSEILEVGPSLTPTGDHVVLGYDRSDYLVYLDVSGCSRVLREDTLAVVTG